MTLLAALGLGYCARRFAALHRDDFSRVVGTHRRPAEAEAEPGVETLAFDGAPSAALRATVAEADVLLISAAPGEGGDPVLAALADDIATGGRRGPIVYLSTIGVYGDSGGTWIDESAPLAGHLDRARRRIEAEAGWQALGRRLGRPVALLRLGGIYGPGRNALRDVADGSARRIVKPGQVFNRIHVDDIAAAIRAAIVLGFEGRVNVVDDVPAPAEAPILHAAALLGREPPPALDFDAAGPLMSAMARSFWADNRRVRNGVLRERLGVELRYPDYRAGLDALHAAGEGS
ncbi:Rossmann-fold NAD(P)-binding domain-containing protein [Ancylobacter terrae]|uniref:NAD-dependent dehydratase n=1 Tax=Ancylobacter sp. sgz301288 TaxID=3342077 RepID=UPI0038593DFD